METRIRRAVIAESLHPQYFEYEYQTTVTRAIYEHSMHKWKCRWSRVQASAIAYVSLKAGEVFKIFPAPDVVLIGDRFLVYLSKGAIASYRRQDVLSSSRTLSALRSPGELRTSAVNTTPPARQRLRHIEAPDRIRRCKES